MEVCCCVFFLSFSAKFLFVVCFMPPIHFINFNVLLHESSIRLILCVYSYGKIVQSHNIICNMPRLLRLLQSYIYILVSFLLQYVSFLPFIRPEKHNSTLEQFDGICEYFVYHRVLPPLPEITRCCCNTTTTNNNNNKNGNKAVRTLPVCRREKKIYIPKHNSKNTKKNKRLFQFSLSLSLEKVFFFYFSPILPFVLYFL